MSFYHNIKDSCMNFIFFYLNIFWSRLFLQELSSSRGGHEGFEIICEHIRFVEFIELK